MSRFSFQPVPFPPLLHYPPDLARIEPLKPLFAQFYFSPLSSLSFYTGNNTDNRSIVFEAIILLTEIYHRHDRHVPHESVNWLLVRSSDIVDGIRLYV